MYYPLGLEFLLDDYFHGTKAQKQGALVRLTKAILKKHETASMLTERLRFCTGDQASEVLLGVAETLDREVCGVTANRENFRQVMMNAIRFYSAASETVRAFRIRRQKTGDKPGTEEYPPIFKRESGQWTDGQIRLELIRIFRENKCNRKAMAERLLTTPDRLRLRFFPRYAIREKEIRKEWILEAVEKTGGKLAEAAKLLGKSSQTLRRRLKEYGVQLESKGQGPPPESEEGIGTDGTVPLGT